MKNIFVMSLILLVGCASNSVSTDTGRSVASISTKMRFFESRMEGDEVPTSLECTYSNCQYIEVEVKNDLLSIQSCSVNESKLLFKTDEEKAITNENINGAKCKYFLKDYEVTDEIAKSVQNQLAADTISTRDPLQLVKSGAKLSLNALMTFTMGTLTVVSAINPEIPLFIVTGPATAATATATAYSGKEFVTELNGKPRVIYKNGSAEQIRNAIDKGGVAVFFIGSREAGFFKRMSMNRTEYESFKGSWKKFARYLQELKYPKVEFVFEPLN